ncbi:MAG: hypothetical protein NT170_00445 [Candidatus Moranbacteria bacterium]|nr:hypothetical protein [Candidatus Moranbacteria bacterium]
MKKIAAGILLGLFFIISGGGIDYSFNIPVKPLSIFLMGIDTVTLLVTVVAAGVIHFRQKLWKICGTIAIAFAIAFGAADACAETIHAKVLTPPAVTPMIQRIKVTGAEVWGLIAILVLVGLVVYWARSSIKKSIIQCEIRGGDCLDEDGPN